MFSLHQTSVLNYWDRNKSLTYPCAPVAILSRMFQTLDETEIFFMGGFALSSANKLAS